MRVLTMDRRARSQLSLLLHDLGYPPKFVTTTEELVTSLSAGVEQQSALLDVRSLQDEQQLTALKAQFPDIRLIGFDLFERTTEQAPSYPKLLDTCIVLPTHGERAKARLKSALRAPSPTTAATKRSGNTRPPIAFKRPASKFSVKAALRAKVGASATQATPLQAHAVAHYITAQSTSSQAFVAHLKSVAADKGIVIFTGDEGAEFELAARELNYQANSDQTPLNVITADDLSLDNLEKVERAAAKAQKPAYCYIGRTDEFDETTALEVSLFLEYLDNLRNPHLRVVLAHQNGSEAFFRSGVEEIVNTIRRKRVTTPIPSLFERAEDIPRICNALLASLRTAHPFLLVSSITDDAIQYLVESRDELTHSKLVRILRNAVALSQRTALCIEDIKNYGESDITTQHLLESMADEGFFPHAEAANS